MTPPLSTLPQDLLLPPLSIQPPAPLQPPDTDFIHIRDLPLGKILKTLLLPTRTLVSLSPLFPEKKKKKKKRKK